MVHWGGWGVHEAAGHLRERLQPPRRRGSGVPPSRCLACSALWVPCFPATAVAGKHGFAVVAHAHPRLRRLKAWHPG